MSKKVKVLYFEGAGCVPRGDVENCRIRTRFINNEGKEIYLEILGFEVTKHHSNIYKQYKNFASIDFCFENNCNEKSRLRELEHNHFEYTKENILSWVNENLNCSFEGVQILDDTKGYRVHGGCNTYNLMENYLE